MINTSFKHILALTAVGIMSTSVASAAAVSPTYTTFGSLPAATFGGGGIPNDSVAITTIGGLTLGLTAHQRYSNPAVGDDGAGTYSAVSGGDLLNGNPAYGRWNFGFYANSSTLETFIFELLWDVNPGVGTDEALLISSTSVIPLIPLLPGQTIQDSYNLGMGFIGGGFDPNASGEYSFVVLAKNLAGQEVGRSAINVNVGSSVPDAGSTLALMGAAFVGIAGLRRKFNA